MLDRAHQLHENLKVLGVHVDGGMAEFISHPRHLVHKAPAGVPWELLPLAEPLVVPCTRSSGCWWSPTEMGFAREVSNRVIFIDDGKIQEDEPPQELFTNPKHPRLKAFLSKML